MASDRIAHWAREDFCYLTTTGRRTGNPHTIEIWYAVNEGHLYMLSGGMERADWVRNLTKEPRVRVRVGNQELPGRAYVVDDPDEDAVARRVVLAKYQGEDEGDDLTDWA